LDGVPIPDILQAIEGLPPAAALRRSFVAYPLVNALHILSLGVLVATVGLMDLRVLGRFARFDAQGFVAALRPVALAAFAGVIVTGLALFSVRASAYAANPAFQLKIVLIGLAGLNLALFLRAARHATGGGGRDGFTVLQRVSAGLSLLLWPCVLLAGRFIGFV
jgi:hypothetical protein